MKRFVVAALTLALILGTAEGQSRQAGASTRLNVVYTGSSQQANGEWREEQCRFGQLNGRSGFSDWEVLRTIRCAERRWSVPGGDEGAICIGRHESGLDEWNDNPDSTAAGVYQFLASTWDSVKRAFATPWWKLKSSVYNARSNVVRAVRKAHAEWSWSAWAVDYLCGL